jgi:hypothetical protein
MLITLCLFETSPVPIITGHQSLNDMFRFFQSADNGQSADCNKAIIIITDELSENYEQVFYQYNWPDKLVCC